MSQEPFSTSDVEVWLVRRRRARLFAKVGLWLVVLPVVGAMVFGATASMFEPGRGAQLMMVWAWVGAWLVGAPIAGAASIADSLRRKLPIRTLAVERGKLHLTGADGEARPVEPAESALVVAQQDGNGEAEITFASGDVLHVRAKGREQELVDSLGFADAARRTVVPLGGARSPLWSALGAVVVSAFATGIATCSGAAVAREAGASGPMLGEVIVYGMGILFVGLTLLLARLTTPRQLTIGADGVLLEGPFRKRFFPRARIFGVETIQGHVSLLLGGGDDVQEVRLTSEHGDRQEALIQRIRGAIEQHGDGEDPRAALLARGSDSIGAWRDRLRKLVAESPGYRSRVLPSDVLVRMAKDADAPADVRVGAAMAIGIQGDEEAKRELRIATDAIANEKLRVAIEAASDGNAEEEAIAAACADAGTWSTGRR